MATVKNQKNGATEKVRTEEPQFSKEQITASARYCGHRDLVDALLDDKKKYTMEQVDKLIEGFMKGKVK